MATVHEARHVELGKRVALKLLARDIAENAVARERFAREGRAAVRIRHPNVVDVTDVGVCDGVPYLVLELVDGPTLSTLFAEGPLPLSRLVELFLPIVSAMHRAHAAGVVHRDLKPANVFLTRDLRGELLPKVGDFGISKVLTPGDRAHQGARGRRYAALHVARADPRRGDGRWPLGPVVDRGDALSRCDGQGAVRVRVEHRTHARDPARGDRPAEPTPAEPARGFRSARAARAVARSGRAVLRHAGPRRRAAGARRGARLVGLGARVRGSRRGDGRRVGGRRPDGLGPHAAAYEPPS
ncbi:MAG: serine/threonine protein kinase [Myxococcales bacterium]|nr:serine/threonine protein kinase [Myxococcales bacterium]